MEDYINGMLTDMYERMEHKEMFLPLIVANAIICHKLAFYDKNYWMEFIRRASDHDIPMEDIEDLFEFFEIFLMESLQFQYAYHGRMERLADFRVFLEDFFFKQKYYFKHPEDFNKRIERCIDDSLKTSMLQFIEEVFDAGARIRFL